MKTLARLTTFIALALSGALVNYAQDASPTAKPGEPAQQSSNSTAAGNESRPAPLADKGTIYFYRIKQFAGAALEPSVFCDDKELARMDNGRYFGVVLEPGKHTCRMGDKQTGFEVDVKAGLEYYAKVTLDTGFWKGHGRLTLLQPEQGAFEIKKVKLLGADKVKDRTLVSIYEGASQSSDAKTKAAVEKQ
ncbi:MAG: DUF2846 domain-containing protein [Pyrinomonadaceae bacterium]